MGSNCLLRLTKLVANTREVKDGVWFFFFSFFLFSMAQIKRLSIVANYEKGSRRSMILCHVCNYTLMELNMKCYKT
jgi:hypothetical protein